MQPRTYRQVQLRLFACVAAVCLLIGTSSATQAPSLVQAVDTDAASGRVLEHQPLIAAADDPTYANDGSSERQSGGYEPDFAYFERSLLGRQAAELGQLNNNRKMEKDIAPETTVYFMFEKAQLEARSDADYSPYALDALNSGDAHAQKLAEREDSETSEQDSAALATGPLQKRQDTAHTVWVSANTCQQPMPESHAPSTGAPQLVLYVSTSPQNQKPGPDSTENLVTNKTGIPFDNGYVSFELNTTSDVYIGVSAPKLNDNCYNRTNPFLFMVDSDSESTLFITYNLTDSNKPEDIAKWNTSNPFSMYAFPAGRSPVTGMENSYCALKQNFNSTNNITVETSITTKFGAGFPKSQFNVHNLSNAQTYNGYLVVEGNQETVDLPGVGRVHGGGKVFQQFNWTTKADDSCQVLTDLEFCDNVAYAVPSSLEFKFDDDRLKALYDDQAKAYFKNFTNSLDQVACDAPMTSQYSLARNCTNCRDDYKTWLCSVLIPRCEDWTANDDFLQPRNIDAPFPNGTIPFASNMSAAFNATTRDRFSFSQSRNPMIDSEIKPGPYKEMLPCEDLCFDIVRSCPAQLQFACPDQPARRLQYGTRDPNGDILTCSFPGAVVKLNVKSFANSIGKPSGSLAFVASLVVAMFFM
ncbi:stretch-activated cation channel mid1 [Curvularia kusanoi]|uniref:Stretch-activated cation channel mid1 n=1 Tax=Curvularia kusanoi TaxID=90978 RepID=A0A9P4TCB1_CURKU|nr:stretch-activated cation channel mid1 [Curvularia kusanoi]